MTQVKKSLLDEGIVILNKPTGVTSHDVVAEVRRRFRIRQVGHAGTLDPLATGVLVMLIGKATKLFNKFESFDKAYKATLILGKKTTTADIQGEIVEEKPYDHITKQDIEKVLKGFLGPVEQIPPMVSAVKVNGKRLYQLARKGLEVKRTPRQIVIDTLELLNFDLPCVKFYLVCSKGTYVRKLAEDIAERLDSVACISEIQRTKVGPFTIDNAIALDQLSEAHIIRWPKDKES
jgi:tRNA pseudouridine55 synthase